MRVRVKGIRGLEVKVQGLKVYGSEVRGRGLRVGFRA